MSGRIGAEYYLVTCYDNGYGVKKNLTEAFNWYMKAAKEGKMEARRGNHVILKINPLYLKRTIC